MVRILLEHGELAHNHYEMLLIESLTNWIRRRSLTTWRHLRAIDLRSSEAIESGSTASGSMTSIVSVSGGLLQDQTKSRSSTIIANTGV